MQGVLWRIIENNPKDVDTVSKAIEKLQIISDRLFNLYHILPYHVEFGAKRHFHINRHDEIFTREQEQELDRNMNDYQVFYEKKFKKLQKQHPNLTEDEVDELIECEEEEAAEKALHQRVG